MKRWFSKFLLPVVALSMAVFGLVHSIRSEKVFAIPRTAPPQAPSRSPFNRTIAAYGLVEAKTENIAIGATLPGVVWEVFATDEKSGSFVRAGDPLFRVDDRHLRAQRELQAASLRVAEAELARLVALPRAEELPPSEAKIKAADANVRMWQDQAERSERLLTARAVSEEQHIERKLKREVAEQELERVRAEDALLRAGAWTQDIDVARAQIELAKAQLAQIETEIERTVVRAPVDGTLLQVNVRPGEYVGTSTGQTLVLLGDSRELHVRVEIDENDIPRFRPGLDATAFVRGDGAMEVPLKFVRVEPFVQPKRWLTSDNTERVDTRVLQVVYAVQPCEATLYVGQTLDIYIELP